MLIQRVGRNKYVLRKNAVVTTSNSKITKATNAPIYDAQGRKTNYEPLEKGATYYELGSYTLDDGTYYKVGYNNIFVKASDVVGAHSEKKNTSQAPSVTADKKNSTCSRPRLLKPLSISLQISIFSVGAIQ